MMLYLLTIACLVGVAFGCYPMKIHLQSTYCDADVAAVVWVASARGETGAWLEYETRVVASVKGINLPQGSDIIVRTISQLNSCGPMPLEVNKAYLILGSAAGPNMIEAKVFNGATSLTDMNHALRLLSQVWSYDCRCRVQTMPFSPNRPLRATEPNECRATSRWGCQWDYGSCVLTPFGCRYMHNCPPTLE